MSEAATFSSLSVNGHKQAMQQKQRAELQDKLNKRAEEQRIKAQMPQVPKPSPMPASVINAFNKKIQAQENSKDRLAIQKINGKIDRYYQHFGSNLLMNKKRKAFNSQTTLQEAQEELRSIQDELASANCYENIESFYLHGADLLSFVGPKVGLRTHNAKQILADPKNLHIVKPELIELSIQYDSWFSQGPLVRLAQKVIFMVKSIHEANTMIEIKNLQAQVPTTVMQKYNVLDEE